MYVIMYVGITRAKKYLTISYKKVLDENLKVMDSLKAESGKLKVRSGN